MERSYERQLADVVGRLPDGPAVVALVPTVPLDQAAALASDVAQIVGSLRGGHTILTSFESGDAKLDHEIGVEEGNGLTDVLTGEVTMARAAAHGRARRFIYVPAGVRAGAGEELLRSDAWRSLAATILDRGGTVLAFVPPEVFEAVNALPSEGAGRRFDALVWLGPAREPGAAIGAAAIASGALVAGSIPLPGSTGRADAAVGEATPEEYLPGRDTHPAIANRPGLVGLRRRGRRRRQSSRGRLLALVVVGGALSMWAGFTIRSRFFSDPEPGGGDFARPDSAAADSLPGDSLPTDSLPSDSTTPGGTAALDR